MKIQDAVAVCGRRRLVILLGAMVLSIATGCATRQAHSGATRVVMLGTGTPNADPDRSGPAVAVVVGDRAYLVDCGPGVVRRASAAYRAGVDALAVEKLERVFITHLHSDHTLGYPDLIFTPWVLGRSVPLEAYGPPGLASMTELIRSAYDQDIRMRLDGLEPANEHGHKVNVHEIESGVVYEDDRVKITAFSVRHGSWCHAFGYRFDTADRSVVISGDTAPCDALIKIAKGCDVLVHAVYSEAGFETRPPKWKRYHAKFHTSTTQLAEIATRVQPGLLVLYHQLYWGSTDDDLVAEVRRGYDGAVVSAQDLEQY